MSLPKMYIIVKLLSVARPAIKRQSEKKGSVVANAVNPFPNNAIKLEITSTCKRPYRSARIPNTSEPITEPTKNIDWPKVDIHVESQTQFN